MSIAKRLRVLEARFRPVTPTMAFDLSFTTPEERRFLKTMVDIASANMPENATDAITIDLAAAIGEDHPNWRRFLELLTRIAPGMVPGHVLDGNAA